MKYILFTESVEKQKCNFFAENRTFPARGGNPSIAQGTLMVLGAQSALWTQKVIFAPKMNFGAQNQFWGPKVTFCEKLPQKSPNSIGSRRGWRAGRQKVILEQKSEKVSKSHFLRKIAKSDSRRQPTFPLAKNTLQRPTPGKMF